MGRKPKFRPKITRIKLNPEQAVLTCDCYMDITGTGQGFKEGGRSGVWYNQSATSSVCRAFTKEITQVFQMCEEGDPGCIMGVAMVKVLNASSS